ncbi:hypothetical protein HMPREF7545_0867 [Selenomonas noxia ATCC 43541]|nr:hypothetical protein HMPREF7545_0867 [Selenomonas noxia ATCC 43541]
MYRPSRMQSDAVIDHTRRQRSLFLQAISSRKSVTYEFMLYDTKNFSNLQENR